MMYKFYVGESAKGRYKMNLGRDLLDALELNLKFSDCVIVRGEGTYEGCLAPIIDKISYDYVPLRDKIVKLEESSLNLYVYECFKS